MIHLDTSFLIRALDSGSPQDRQLRNWVASGATFGMSAVAWTEFLCGPLHPSALAIADELIGPRADFTARDATVAARLFNESGRRRGSLLDCMIAATALAEGAQVATVNVKDFRRFEAFGLRLV
ncbi:type II toxin-antitoxin system VapC family toxin [Candidatus Palauibacter sp.]|uniref:type II toxin-antitoxin system VapC family toxin n=1 Tax=Candidatus Palauibacter sp. TaxID=3101350 RepID=UPI003B013279